MRRKIAVLVVGMVCALGTSAPAFASGGAGGGGDGGGGGGGGGTVSGGGGGKGGVKDVAPAPVVPCATLPSVSAPVGYYLTWAAVWNTFTVKSCASGSETVNVEVTETNVATGLVEYDMIVPFGLTAGQNAGMVLDNDFAPFDTSYTVTMQVSDTSGNPLASQSLVATTPPPR